MGNQFYGEIWDLLSRVSYDHHCLFCVFCSYVFVSGVFYFVNIRWHCLVLCLLVMS